MGFSWFTDLNERFCWFTVQMQFLIVSAKIAKKRSITAVLSQKIEKHLLLSNHWGSDCNRCIIWCGWQDLPCSERAIRFDISHLSYPRERAVHTRHSRVRAGSACPSRSIWKMRTSRFAIFNMVRMTGLALQRARNTVWYISPFLSARACSAHTAQPCSGRFCLSKPLHMKNANLSVRNI